jgi:tagatose 1,6-diphosphate aldolase
MKSIANQRGVIAILAMDQRSYLQRTLAAARGVNVHDATPAMMSEFKVAVSRLLTPHASAILLDSEFGLEAARARFQRGPAAGL